MNVKYGVSEGRGNQHSNNKYEGESLITIVVFLEVWDFDGGYELIWEDTFVSCWRNGSMQPSTNDNSGNAGDSRPFSICLWVIVWKHKEKYGGIVMDCVSL